MVPVLVRVLGGWRTPDRAGVVDEHIDIPPVQLCDEGANGRSIGQIALHCDEAPPQRPYLVARAAAIGLHARANANKSAPAAASAVAIARPIPRRQPVTSAVLPVRSKGARMAAPK